MRYRHKKPIPKKKRREVDGDEDGMPVDMIECINDILKAYEATRRRFFWSSSKESSQNLKLHIKGSTVPASINRLFAYSPLAHQRSCRWQPSFSTLSFLLSLQRASKM